MRIHWPHESPTYIAEAAAGLNTGELVHFSLWAEEGRADRVCMGENLSSPEIVKLVSELAAKSLIQFNPDWFGNDLRSSIELRATPQRYFHDAGNTLLGGVESSWTWNFSHREEKSLLKDRVLGVAQGTEAMRESLGLVFEELFMNAVIDAPREAYSDTNSRAPAPLSQMTLTRRGNRLCLSCTDPYGTLKIQKFVARMHQVYSEGAGKVINFNSERGGAGLGCVLLFEHSSVLALGVDHGCRTVVSCVIPAWLNHRQKDTVRKSFHWIESGIETRSQFVASGVENE